MFSFYLYKIIFNICILRSFPLISDISVYYVLIFYFQIFLLLTVNMWAILSS